MNGTKFMKKTAIIFLLSSLLFCSCSFKNDYQNTAIERDKIEAGIANEEAGNNSQDDAKSKNDSTNIDSKDSIPNNELTNYSFESHGSTINLSFSEGLYEAIEKETHDSYSDNYVFSKDDYGVVMVWSKPYSDFDMSGTTAESTTKDSANKMGNEVSDYSFEEYSDQSFSGYIETYSILDKNGQILYCKNFVISDEDNIFLRILIKVKNSSALDDVSFKITQP